MANQQDKDIDRILEALRVLSSSDCLPLTLPPQGLWPKTRDIANYCDLSIYSTRHYLMKLVHNHRAYVSAGLLHNSLRWWYIAESIDYSLPEE